MGAAKIRKSGKRALKTAERNDAIRKAAMSLANGRKWPSPSAVAEKSGISLSVVERETSLLIDARRKWEKVTGRKHPQWRDPEIVADEGTMPATPPADVGPAARTDEKAKRDKQTIKAQRETIAGLKEKVAELEEQVRRLMLQVRPAELGAILEIGAAKRRKGKAKKRVAVAP